MPDKKIIDHHIVDLYCAKAKLVIEVDGSQHYTEEGIRKDKIRTETLEQYSLKIIRFTNKQVRDEFNAVCRQIEQHLCSPPRPPLPRGDDAQRQGGAKTPTKLRKPSLSPQSHPLYSI